MPSFKRPDVFVQEVTPRPFVRQGETADAQPALVGESARGPIVPTLVANWSEFTRLYGSFESSTYLSHAAYQYFLNGGGAVLVQRVIGASAVQATRTFNDTAGTPLPTVTIKAKNAGAWGNSLYISVVANTGVGKFDLVVKYGGTSESNVVERFYNLSMDSADSKYAPTYIANFSDYITLIDLDNATPLATKAPAAAVDQVLATGADGSSVVTADITAAFAQFDLEPAPLVVALPGITDTTALTTIIQSAASSGKNFIVVDVPAYTDTAAYLTYTAALPVSDYAAVYGPWLQVVDPSKTNVQVLKSVPPSGAVLGRFSAVDIESGVQQTPAGTSEGVLLSVVDVEVIFSTADLDSLNSNAAPVNVIRPLPNRGVCIMGGRTLDTRTATRYVANRRSLIYIRQSLQDLCQFAVFEPNDEDLWDSLTNTCTRFLSDFRGAGGLRGADDSAAFYVVCDSTTNTPLSVQNGEVNVQVGVALEYPAEFVIVRVGLFEGGASASEITA